MADAEDRRPLYFKRKQIIAFLPYAVWQEQDGKPEMLDTFLRAARGSRSLWFSWYRVRRSIVTLLSEASPRTTVLVSPYLSLDFGIGNESLIQQWAAAVSAVQYTEEVGQSVVDALLQIGGERTQLLHIPTNIWSWLTKRPSLPPVCLGRRVGTREYTVEAVRALKDIEILKSYFLLVWSEWDGLPQDGVIAMCNSIREDFSGIEMSDNRAELIQRLDHVLEQLGQGSEYLEQHNPNPSGHSQRKRRYTKLREMLLEVERCTPSSNDYTFLYTDFGVHASPSHCLSFAGGILTRFICTELSAPNLSPVDLSQRWWGISSQYLRSVTAPDGFCTRVLRSARPS